MALRRHCAAFARRRAITGLLLAFAAFLAMPMPAAPHQIGDSDHDPGCTYDYCHSPEFMVPAPAFEIPDNIGQSQEVGALPVATDADHSDPNIAYTMVYTLRDGDAPVADDDEDKPEYADGDAAAFTIYNDGNGQPRLRTAIDHYETRVYRLKLVACDGTFRRGYIDVTIIVNDAPGERPLAPDRPEVEGASTSSLVVRWTAPDNTGRAPITSYDLQYRESGTQNWRNGPQNRTDTYAVISGLTENTQYEVQVQATNEDGDGPWSEPGTGWTKTARNNPPVFLEPSPTRSFDENTLAGRNIGGPVEATGESALEYSLEGTDAASFDIVATSGQIRTTTGVTYDYEDTISNTYTVTVKATDQNANSGTITVTIEITNVEERPLAPAAPSVSSESTTSLSVIWTAPDNAGRPSITGYDLQYRPGTSGTWMDGPQGLSGTSRSAIISGLNEDTPYQVQVRATNVDGDGPWSPPGPGRTLAEDNAAPGFGAGTATRSIPENTGPDQDVGAAFTATDADNDPLTYALEGQDAASFDLVTVGSSAQIRTKAGVTYDHEAKSTYFVTVKADDGKGGTDVIAVTISVTDVPEPPDAPAAPSVSSASTTSLSVIWSPPANNAGRPPVTGYRLQYREVGTSPWTGPLNQSGTSTIITNLNADTQYEVQVLARNGEGDSPWSDSGFGRTNVAGNNAPEFVGDMTTRRFRENTPPGRNIGEPVTALDADGDTLTYTLEGRDAGSFTIVGTSGQIRTRSGVTYDYETKRSYVVTVKVDDRKGGTDIIAVTIYVTDADEGGRRPGGDGSPSFENREPAFPDILSTRSFPENTPPGRNIGEPVTAKVVVGPLTYTLRGADAASFDIDSSTGQLKTKAGVTYDYEVKSSYAVTVRATGSTNISANVAVTINVENVAEKPSAPDAPTVSAPDGSRTSLLVTWTTPDVNGGPPITGYEVEYRQGTSGVWVPWPHGGTDTTTTITELSAGNDYQVRIRARNADGFSEWSPPGSGRTNAGTMNGWLARFGRSIAQQMMEGVGDRLASPCRTGLQGTLAGHGFGNGGTGSAGGALSPWAVGDPEAERLLDSRLLVQRHPVSGTGSALLAGTVFELGSETAGNGVTCVWGRGGHSGFSGRDGSLFLDGDVTTGTLGADYTKDLWTVGLALSHSRGEGSYASKDSVEASLTGVFPYAGYRVTERFSVWGLGGFGRGGLTVRPENGSSLETGLGLAMVAVGARGAFVTAAETGGIDVTLETDGFWVRTDSAAATGLLAAKGDASRLRLGLESSYTATLRNGGTLTPRFRIGWRYDGGGAETGLGVDIGGGLLWSAPARGISAEIGVRRVLMHEATGFNDWSLSGLVRYDPNPSSERGALLALRSSIGTPSLVGSGGLLERDNLLGLATSDTAQGGQLSAEAAYGFPILGGRFTGAPWVGAGVLESGRDYRVGYRISRTGLSGSGMQAGIEGLRRENGGSDAEAEHAIGLRLGLGW